MIDYLKKNEIFQGQRYSADAGFVDQKQSHLPTDLFFSASL